MTSVNNNSSDSLDVTSRINERSPLNDVKYNSNFIIKTKPMMSYFTFELNQAIGSTKATKATKSKINCN
jgi:hypothetical protein